MRTVRGSAATNEAIENGRNSLTFSTPTFSPRAARYSTVSWAVSAPEPIITMTRSASGCPTYSNSLIPPARQRRKPAHQAFHHAGARVVIAIRRLARLKEDIRVLRRAPQHGPVRREPALAMRAHMVFGDQRAQVVIRQLFDLGHFVRGAEAVEEVQERNPQLERRGVRDGREIVSLLHRPRAQHGEPGLAAGHDVGVVAEDRQRVRGQRSAPPRAS